jgi:hypothetical protein
LSVITVDDLSCRIESTGDPEPAILALRSTIPAGVAGDADEAGDVDVEREREGVSGVFGGLLQDEAELGEEEGMGFGGDRWLSPNAGIGLELEQGGGTGVDELVALAAFFDTIWSEYVG